MKRYLILLMLPLLFISCSNRKTEVAPVKTLKITVEAQSDGEASLYVPTVFNQQVKGTFKKSFDAVKPQINVYLTSVEPTLKSIIIYVDDKEVARRSVSCEVDELDLSYDLNAFY